MSLRIVHEPDLSADDHRLLFERTASLDDLLPAARSIMDDVRGRGDQALLDLTERFDGVRLESPAVTRDEFESAHATITPAVRTALEELAATAAAFHAPQLPAEKPVETAPGVLAWREWRPIERIGLYVPGGRGPYPSSVMMLGVPARIAGCPQVVLCTPPGQDGRVPAATLVAADLVDIHQVFKVGGAQAIAAMAFGTESVPRVDKLFGAGNAWVTAAKLLAFPGCDLDAPAGPSELLIVADESADPRWIAADLLSDVEHGPDSPAVLVTTSPDVARETAAEVERQLVSLPRAEIARRSLETWGLIVLVDNRARAAALASRYAAEHLELMVEDPRDLLRGIDHAGSVFLGPYAPNAAGDYATGTNHVLPTSRYARTFAAVSVDSFGRMMQCQELTEAGLRRLLPTVQALAREEGLEGHARAAEVRFGLAPLTDPAA